MPALAHNEASANGKPAPSVFRWRDGLKMVRIHARAVAAKMIEMETVGNRASPCDPCRAMRANPKATHLERSIPIDQRALPHPTLRVGIDNVSRAHGCMEFVERVLLHKESPERNRPLSRAWCEHVIPE